MLTRESHSRLSHIDQRDMNKSSGPESLVCSAPTVFDRGTSYKASHGWSHRCGNHGGIRLLFHEQDKMVANPAAALSMLMRPFRSSHRRRPSSRASALTLASLLSCRLPSQRPARSRRACCYRLRCSPGCTKVTGHEGQGPKSSPGRRTTNLGPGDIDAMLPPSARHL